MSEIEGRPAPFEHVLVATDFSQSADRAVDRAGRLPLGGQGRYSIVHVLPDGIPEALLGDAESYARLRLEQARSKLVDHLEDAGREPVDVSTGLCRGVGYVEINRYAKAVGADLIVLGRHGNRPVKDLLIGSTADRVIRLAELPVLVVNKPPRQPYRRPLLGIALAGSDRDFVKAVCRVLSPESSAASMVHAYHVPFEGLLMLGVSTVPMRQVRAEYRQLAAAGLARLQASVADLGIRWKTILVRGDARNAIIAEAIRRGSDLIAVGTHVLPRLERALVGSVAEAVIRSAVCDVLVARTAGDPRAAAPTAATP
jgi:nucleotide-binding universal stress UspA family protein